MELTSADKEALFLLHKPGSVVKALEKLEWDMATACEEDPKLFWGKSFTKEEQEKRLIRRAEYCADLMIIEMMAFHKGVDAAAKWIEEFK